MAEWDYSYFGPPGLSQIAASRPMPAYPEGAFDPFAADAFQAQPPPTLPGLDDPFGGLPLPPCDSDALEAAAMPHQRSTPFIAPREGPLVPPALMARLRSRPWSYQALSRWLPDALDRINDNPMRAMDSMRALGYTRTDTTLTFDDWLLASERLLDALAHIDAAAFQLFSYYFQLIRERYAPDWWPALRAYDLAIRRAHTLRTTADLETFDDLRFAHLLLEHDPAVDPAPTTASSPLSQRPAYIYGHARAVRPGGGPAADAHTTRLDILLESLKPGLGNDHILVALADLGITSSRHLAELAVFGVDSLQEVLSQPSPLTPYERVMLRELLGRRFATQELHDHS